MKKEFRSGCPVSSSLDVVGDKWSLLIIRDMLVKHKKTFKQMSDSYEKIAPSILSARLKLLESYKLIFKTKAPENKKENIYLLTEKGIRLTPIIIEFSLWGNYNMREFNEIDDIEGLNLDKTLIIQKIQDSYNSMLLNFR
ncbi:helix-turn-helix transcriptional regulator [Flavobacteriaceae bacterium]|jgi:DNA-binding HxlR family transcriptional regulator|nr:helix-turn-helix transcriptional regulator [Flavobacteriaceae bacterium]MDA9241933.1 helix-turn-helix transcriptional regulator [Flavobacteriaceae bacterium]MDB0069386.1 helix-turn-helix transcriptional regulator [Flavobacteriaceae bacterium]MDB4196600.1 helix-turn-helix transcriptional regulator [Flavobacteriaceae bacterium]MDB4240009.1 helix-turn-helix transcriptional regulator [Flavobacteriaceae bacterium]|tara:strand:+ start:320 stop:739 length:420 start_codon:yes stop_codon:yes gene_type:complete